MKRPDLQLHFVIGIVENHMRPLHFKPGYSCHVCVLRPHSRGRVTLASPRAGDAPRIDPGFLGDPRDLNLMMAGGRRMGAMLRARPLTRRRKARLHDHGWTDTALERDIRAKPTAYFTP